VSFGKDVLPGYFLGIIIMREGLFYDIMVDVDERPDGWNKELYDKLSFEYLIECAKNGRIEEWNLEYEKYLKSEWERIFPDKGYDSENIGKLFYLNYSFVRLNSGFVQPYYHDKDFNKALFEGFNLTLAKIYGGNLSGVRLDGADFTHSNLEGLQFSNAHLEGANLFHSNLKETDFIFAHLEGANFTNTDLDGAKFIHSNLERVFFINAKIYGANFARAHLDRADFECAHLEGANLRHAHIEGANFSWAHLEGATFTYAIVNGETLFVNNTIDTKTDFTGTSLSSVRSDPELRTQLERNIRQIRWEHWYKDNKILEIPAKVFWKISDYGSSTRDILFTFLFSNFIFMMFYLALRDADLLHGTILSSGNDLLLAYMQTTLVPFGILGIDLATLSVFPVFIIFIQVIFGYTILAALVTRMAIMFQNLSP